MHDTTWFEINGKPAVFIASDEFQEAATAQAETLGLPGVQRVFVPHPIQAVSYTHLTLPTTP